MLVQSVFLWRTLSLVLRLAGKAQCLRLVEVSLGVNAGSLLGDALFQDLRYLGCLSFACSHDERREDVSCG